MYGATDDLELLVFVKARSGCGGLLGHCRQVAMSLQLCPFYGLREISRRWYLCKLDIIMSYWSDLI